MDGQRFDAWTRVLSRRLRRRGALKTLAGVALAGATIRTAPPDARAFCSEEGQDCDTMDCCEGLVCSEGVCVAVGSPDCPTLNQSNQCSNLPTKCEGNGCKKKKKKKHERKGGRKKRGR